MNKNYFAWKLLIAFAIILSACAKSPYAHSNKFYKKQTKVYAKLIRENPAHIWIDSVAPAEWVGTVNFNLRKPNFVVIHHTAQNGCNETLRAFTLSKSQVSAHYVICKDGTVYHMLNDYLRAWHGGKASWGNVTDLNSTSIGIELDNNGFEAFTQPQITNLLHVLSYLKKTYFIPTANFIGHADIAPERKNDPNVYFPWKLLADNGFGLWYGDTTGQTIPEGFNKLEALRIIGYNIHDSTAAMRAFKRHFLQDTLNEWQEADSKVLLELYRRYF